MASTKKEGKMADTSSKGPIIRAMTMKDLDGIAEIDKKVLGQSRLDYWERKLKLVEQRSPISSLVAEMDGKIVGFVIGDASGWQFGFQEDIGFIDTVGVDPAAQRAGIAKMLLTEMVDNLKKVGVGRIYTFVNWRDWDLLQFFDAMGFHRGDMINLEMKV
jgi:ribosomal protein S18 acetylase RimI-like enzyme